MDNQSYYKPGEIVFTRHQILWLLAPVNLFEIQAGRWPTDGATVEVSTAKARPQGYFEVPMEILAELEMRIERCGRHGEIYLYRFIGQHSARETMFWYHIGKDEVYRISKRVLRYIMGRERKTADYREWSKRERYN